MNEWTQIFTSVGLSGLLIAIINAVLGRKKMSAEATEIITNAAGTMTDRLERQVKSMQDRLNRFEYDEQRRRVVLEAHMRWDLRVMEKLRKALPECNFPDPPPLYLPTHEYRADYEPTEGDRP